MDNDCLCIYCLVILSNIYNLKIHYKSKKCKINKKKYKKKILNNKSQENNYKKKLKEYKR